MLVHGIAGHDMASPMTVPTTRRDKNCGVILKAIIVIKTAEPVAAADFSDPVTLELFLLAIVTISSWRP